VIEIARRLRAEDGKIIAVHVFDKIPSFASYYMSPDKKNFRLILKRKFRPPLRIVLLNELGLREMLKWFY
jgi:hypothetical protein